eukprot:85572-Amphidinium_carterae.1
MEAAEEQDIIPPLDEHHIDYLATIEGDTPEDEIRLQQMHVINDDMQSIIDENIEAERRHEEIEEPEHAFWSRQLLHSAQNEMDDEGRYAEGRERQQRRGVQNRARHEGSEQALRERYQGLYQMVMRGRRQFRRQRLEAAQREAARAQEVRPTDSRPPKAPPTIVQQQIQQRTQQVINSLTLQELREKVH